MVIKNSPQVFISRSDCLYQSKKLQIFIIAHVTGTIHSNFFVTISTFIKNLPPNSNLIQTDLPYLNPPGRRNKKKTTTEHEQKPPSTHNLTQKRVSDQSAPYQRQLLLLFITLDDDATAAKTRIIRPAPFFVSTPTAASRVRHHVTSGEANRDRMT